MVMNKMNHNNNTTLCQLQ